MFKATGKLIYDPRSEAASRKGFQSWWMILDTPESIPYYYRYWLKREIGLSLNAPVWRSHVTVCRGETPKKQWNWKKYEGRRITFEYSPEIKLSETYAWLSIYSRELEEIRVELGLAPQPFVRFHLTIGNTKNKPEPKQRVCTAVTFPWERPEIVDRLVRGKWN